MKLFSGVNSVGNFGYNGTSGGVIIEAGAEMSLPAFVIGNANNSTGSLAVVGGKLVAHLAGESSLSIIGNSGVGSMMVTDGAEVVVSNRLTIGVQDKGSLEIDSAGAMTVGRLTLGNILNDASANKGYSIVTVGSGSLRVTDQMVWRAAGAQQRTNVVSVGKGVGGGGLLALPATVRSAVNQSWARLTVDGGEILFNGLNDSSYGATLDDYLYGLDEFWVGRAGVTINTSNFNATVTQVLKSAPAGISRGGGFTKVGAGRLTLAGGLECTGPVTVGEGVLRLQGVEPTGVVNLLDGGGLSLVDGAYGEFAPAKVVAGQSGVAYVELEAGDGGACDSLWLSVGSQLGVVEFSLVALNDTASYWLPGEYVVARYESSAPQISSWYAVVPHGISATFEVQDSQKQVVLRVVKTLEGAAQWLAPGSGAWNDDGNWSYLPANDPGTKVVFSDIAKENSQVTLANQVTLGGMVIDSPWSYTFSGESLMFGATGVAGLLDIKRGAHTIQTELVAHGALTIAARSGVALALQDRVTGSGSLAVKGGCDLIVDDISGVETPLSFDDVAVHIKSGGSFDEALTIQEGGLRLTADSGSTLDFTAAVAGVGELVKGGSNIIAFEDVAGLAAPVTLHSGTLELSNFPDGTLVLGEGTLRYKGESTVFNHDIVISTTLATQATTFESDADVVVNGNVYTNSGSFIKTGSGTLTFAAPGVNVFGYGNLTGSMSKQCLNWGPYGESPTKGFVQAAIVNGKVVLGCEGQYNRFVQTLTIGAESTMAPGAETAAHLEINGGETVGNWFALGRGNGSAITAPEGLESTLRVNGGSLTLNGGLWLGLRNDDMESVTAHPLFEMNGGQFVCRALTIGSERPGNARPRLVFKGGTTLLPVRERC